jgi:predicted dehydrogenase
MAMDILFIGFSSIVQRKVLPAAIKASNIEKISFASSKSPDLSDQEVFEVGKIYGDYDSALSDNSGMLVYISFPNALHAEWVEKVLLSGNHVIVDKPAFMTLDEAKRLVDLANSSNLLLAEANVWTYHSLFNEIRGIINGREVHSIYANFSSPQLDSSNFRYQPGMGAGILLDRGSYAVSCVRELIPGVVEDVFCSQRFSETHEGVDLDLSLIMSFDDRSSFLGFFSLECEYTNSLEIIGKDFRLHADRVFTPPPCNELKIDVQTDNNVSTITAGPCDAFQVFLEEIVDSLDNDKHRKFSNILLNDAVMFERILQVSHLRAR